MNPLEWIHQYFVHPSRVDRIADEIAPLVENRGKLLDIGCGDGKFLSRILKTHNQIEGVGIDVETNQKNRNALKYDGKKIPAEDREYNWATLIDVLHHADDPSLLLEEAARVADVVLIKDHLADGILSKPTLEFMDRLGNSRFGINLPFHYYTKNEWLALFEKKNLKVETLRDQIKLYPTLVGLPFNRNLHFIAKVRKEK